MAPRLKLSIVIPVGPGDTAWRDLLDDLAVLKGAAEVILVAPTGETPPDFVPADHGLRIPARWQEAPAGRARQQNAGAADAAGETLWFLHADSRLTAAATNAAMAFCGHAALGYFNLEFDTDGPWLTRLNALGARLRSRWLGLPFGDQGLLLPRRLFDAIGGFDESLHAGEDHALVWAARRAGIPLASVGVALRTSGRRYAEHGWLRTTLHHASLTVTQAYRFARSSAAPRDRS